LHSRLVGRHSDAPGVLVGCPDARPPAYQAVAGIADAAMLGTFTTSFYDTPANPALAALPARWRVRLARRRHTDIPDHRVHSHPEIDLALAVENRLKTGVQRRAVARWRTDWFDRCLARRIEREDPSAVLLFSDVGSRRALPRCVERNIPALLSVVHGDPAEERAVLEREAERSPEYFPLYLGDGNLDLTELRWLHERREAERELATLLLVPSEHIADRLRGHGVSPQRIRVIPYAADRHRFRPGGSLRSKRECRFLFAGGLTQRKGIGYLLAAWRMVARAGWTLQLVGGLPRRLGPLEADLAQPGVEWLGRVGHDAMPGVMAEADVFVFPSLFEGSAVVTYEALAAGLPSIVTREAGSVAREGREGLVVPAADPQALAEAMERLGSDSDLRHTMAAAARTRGEQFDWPRYRRAVADVVRSVLGS
jgi:glycosyltransferase involved in cell wall biosynthesis